MKNITWHEHKIKKQQKQELLNQIPFVLWFTGLSGSGKSSIAVELEKKIFESKKLTALLDGDNIRHGLCSDLGFSVEERKENLRRIRETAKLFYDNAIITIVSFISPLREEREFARNLIGQDFIEIFVDCPYEECAKRDPKGLYKKVIAGEIKGFTGKDQIYEKPENPEIIINSDKVTVEQSVDIIINYLKERKYL